jgi:hypothetical protein
MVALVRKVVMNSSVAYVAHPGFLLTGTSDHLYPKPGLHQALPPLIATIMIYNDPQALLPPLFDLNLPEMKFAAQLLTLVTPVRPKPLDLTAHEPSLIDI